MFYIMCASNLHALRISLGSVYPDLSLYVGSPKVFDGLEDHNDLPQFIEKEKRRKRFHGLY
jgi:hypothetical protein